MINWNIALTAPAIVIMTLVMVGASGPKKRMAIAISVGLEKVDEPLEYRFDVEFSGRRYAVQGYPQEQRIFIGQYLGDRGGPEAEVSEGSYIPVSQSGADVFWAEKQQAISGYDARDWRASADSAFLVDGRRVEEDVPRRRDHDWVQDIWPEPMTLDRASDRLDEPRGAGLAGEHVRDVLESPDCRRPPRPFGEIPRRLDLRTHLAGGEIEP